MTTPALMGGTIGSQGVSVAAGDDEILIFPWMPPNPADYASFGADQSHFCLLARTETSSTPPYGMTFPESSNLYANVQNNNNIVWKNISVVDEVPGAGRFASVSVANFSDEIERATLVFLTPQRERPSIFNWGQVFVELPPDLMKYCDQEDSDSAGVRRFDDTTLQVLKSGARLGTFELAPDEVHTLRLWFTPIQRHSLGVRVFALDLLQRSRDRTVGGQRFVLKSVPDARLIATDDATSVFDGVTWVPVGKGASGNSCCC